MLFRSELCIGIGLGYLFKGVWLGFMEGIGKYRRLS